MITKIFKLTARALLAIAGMVGLTYNAVNIIVYYMIVPLTWAVMLDKICRTWPVMTGVWTLVCLAVVVCHRRDFVAWCDVVFQKSVDFLLWFGRIGWDYYTASVIICVLVPALIYAALIALLWLQQ